MIEKYEKILEVATKRIQFYKKKEKLLTATVIVLSVILVIVGVVAATRFL